MPLAKTTVIDQIEITELGSVHVRRATWIEEDGVRISGPTYHRSAYVPGSDLSQEDPSVQAHADVAWTPAVIARYRAENP